MPQKPRHTHYTELASWEELNLDGQHAFRAHFNYVADYTGARQNLEKSRLFSFGNDDWNRRELNITIKGKENCEIFIRWIGKDCMPLLERFMEQRFIHSEIEATYHRHSQKMAAFLPKANTSILPSKSPIKAREAIQQQSLLPPAPSEFYQGGADVRGPDGKGRRGGGNFRRS